MFASFWAFQIFIAKLGFISGAKILPFQIILILTAFITLAVFLDPKSGVDLVQIFKHRPALFWKLFLANAFQSGLGTCFSIIGIALTDAINAGFLVKLATVSTILFAWLILKEKLSGLKIGIVFVMLFGAYLLTTKGQTMLPRIGDLFILAACVCWSLGNVLVRKFMQSEAVNADVVTMQKPVASLPVFGVLIGISLFVPEILGNLDTVLDCCTFTPVFIPYAIGSGICLAMAWIYLYRTLKIATASYMTLMSMVTPIIVAVLAMVFLKEQFVLVQLVGGSLILLSGIAIYFSDIAYS
ncbi:MAG: DMT family transporter [Chloroflexi bacterium]|nr:DMT family transporter [Chloroflexota bacterium]